VNKKHTKQKVYTIQNETLSVQIIQQNTKCTKHIAKKEVYKTHTKQKVYTIQNEIIQQCTKCNSFLFPLLVTFDYKSVAVFRVNEVGNYLRLTCYNVTDHLTRQKHSQENHKTMNLAVC